jgi:hypothetical protein
MCSPAIVLENVCGGRYTTCLACTFILSVPLVHVLFRCDGWRLQSRLARTRTNVVFATVSGLIFGVDDNRVQAVIATLSGCVAFSDTITCIHSNY